MKNKIYHHGIKGQRWRNELKHIGTPNQSGRYKRGSGEDPHQHVTPFLTRVSELKKTGMSDTDIARALNMSTTDFRIQKSIEKNQIKAINVSKAVGMKEHGYTNSQIAKELGKNESVIRDWLSNSTKEKVKVQGNVTEALRQAVTSKKMVDIGPGSELSLGVSRGLLKKSVSELKKEGYNQYEIQIQQPFSPNKYTNVLTLTEKSITFKEAFLNRGDIMPLGKYSEDNGHTILGIEPITNVSRSRVGIRYGDKGGKDKDGIIELRPGVPDLDLRGSLYSQVRIGVEGTHYIKGMAVYSTDLPKGIDILFNTDKNSSVPMIGTKETGSVLKNVKDDPDNPFGSIVRQFHYTDSAGNSRLSALNVVGSKEGAGEEGSVGGWSKSLSSQFLSKQSPSLAKRQLGIKLESMKSEYNNIMKLTNPALKQKMLEDLAETADSASVHLKAASLPRQSNHYILSIPQMRTDQVYAPNFKNGERVVLIRHPHAGPFEIPELTVNNRATKHNAFMKNAKDAIGIHPDVAKILSGADFDGDTVLVIPNNGKAIKNNKPLKGLEDFDPKTRYPAYPGMKKISAIYKEKQMGEVSNLITDMSLRNATDSELARAVRHSMVIIDAEKHNLNYKLSYQENGIRALKQKYQSGQKGGASTLISRAGSTLRVPAVQKTYIDSKTGKLVKVESGKSYTDKNGKTVLSVDKVKRLSVEDPFSLSSGTTMEAIYAQHSSDLKALADLARKSSVNLEPSIYSPTAAKQFSKEVASLDSKLKLAISNKPLERRAMVLTSARIQAKLKDNPELRSDSKELKKVKTQILNQARLDAGAKKEFIEITRPEWDAIQAGAVSSSKTKTILANLKDMEIVKEYAMPKEESGRGLTSAKLSRASALLNMGYTQAEVAQIIGVSVSTITSNL